MEDEIDYEHLYIKLESALSNESHIFCNLEIYIILEDIKHFWEAMDKFKK